MKQRKSDESGEESKRHDINKIPIVEIQSVRFGRIILTYRGCTDNG